MNTSSIGMFDSGAGGLSILQSIHTVLPHESIIYVGDHAYSPYGDKSPEFIRERAVALIKFLISRNCKLIVAACNTATIAGIDYYRKFFPTIPIIGVVPVVKTAAASSKSKHFIVLSTHFTAISHYQRDLIHRWAGDCKVMSLGSSLLVPLIEEGKVSGEEVTHELRDIFNRVKHVPYDVVVLGCTHYPFVRRAIRAIVGEGVQIIDSGGAVARQVARILTVRNNLSDGIRKDTFITTGETKKVQTVFQQLLEKDVTVSHVVI